MELKQELFSSLPINCKKRKERKNPTIILLLSLFPMVMSVYVFFEGHSSIVVDVSGQEHSTHLCMCKKKPVTFAF